MALRLKLGMKQGEFADRVGVSPSFQNQLEKGRRVPTPAYVGVMAARLDFSDEERSSWLRAGARACGWNI